MNCVEKQLTYKKRLGYVLSKEQIRSAPPEHPGVLIAGRRWGTCSGVVLVVPDLFLGNDQVQPLPSGVAIAMTNYDDMVKL